MKVGVAEAAALAMDTDFVDNVELGFVEVEVDFADVELDFVKDELAFVEDELAFVEVELDFTVVELDFVDEEVEVTFVLVGNKLIVFEDEAVELELDFKADDNEEAEDDPLVVEDVEVDVDLVLDDGKKNDK